MGKNIAHPSDSSTQLNAEKLILEAAERELNVKFEPAPPELATLRLDGFVGGDQPILVEVYAHVGKCKPGQVRKLSRDMTKLLLAEKMLDKPSRKLLVVCDHEAIAHFDTGWDGWFALAFGIELMVAEVEQSVRDELKQVQNRQRR